MAIKQDKGSVIVNTAKKHYQMLVINKMTSLGPERDAIIIALDLRPIGKTTIVKSPIHRIEAIFSKGEDGELKTIKKKKEL